MRVFVAVPLPENIKEKIDSEITSELKGIQGVKTVPKENLHITIKFLGEVSKEKVDLVVNAVKEIFLEPFSVEISGVGAFPSWAAPRVLWVGAKGRGFEHLYSAVNKRTERIRREDKPFHPHVTVARVKTRGANLTGFFKKFEGFQAGEFVVDRIVVYESILRPEGPKYIELFSRRFE